jgi:hypothetical protein
LQAAVLAASATSSAAYAWQRCVAPRSALRNSRSERDADAKLGRAWLFAGGVEEDTVRNDGDVVVRKTRHAGHEAWIRLRKTHMSPISGALALGSGLTRTTLMLYGSFTIEYITQKSRAIMTCKNLANVCHAIMLALVACDDEPTSVYEDTGAVCLSQQDGRMKVRLSVDACLRPACRVQKEALCRASVEGQRITITSRVEVAEPDTDEACVDGCGAATPTCDFAIPGDGTYEVVHGDDRGSLVLPLIGATPVFGGPEACNSLGSTDVP